MAKSKIALTAALLLAGGSLAACGGGEGTDGLNTTCESYLAMDADQQEKVVLDIAREGGESNPDQADVDMVQDLMVQACDLQDDKSQTLEDITGGY